MNERPIPDPWGENGLTLSQALKETGYSTAKTVWKMRVAAAKFPGFVIKQRRSK